TEPRLSAHLWRLTTAWECLDMLAVQRQLRALDLLAEETGSARVGFFALARRAMYSLVVEELSQADRLIEATATAGRATPRTVGSVVAVAAGVGLTDLASAGAGLLEPYAGRAVLNAGAVSFHGVVDDYLCRGYGGATSWRHSALSCYDRIGARHWRDRLGGQP